MVYLISYDLRAPGRDYENLYRAIRSVADVEWCRPLESVYLIKSSKSANTIFQLLYQHIDTSDHLLVIEVTRNYSGYLAKEIVDYLSEMM